MDCFDADGVRFHGSNTVRTAGCNSRGKSHQGDSCSVSRCGVPTVQELRAPGSAVNTETGLVETTMDGFYPL